MQRSAAAGTSGVAGRGRHACQHTLKNRIRCSGIGLHSGARVTMTLYPAEAGRGIVFRRRDLSGAPEIPATWRFARETPLCTTVATERAQVATVEHLLSALAGLGIDNVVAELDGPEVPVMDGSAAPFVFLVECAGVVRQPAVRRAIRIRRPVRVEDGGRGTSLQPAARGLSLDFRIDFDNRVIARQELSVRLDAASYKRELARARTFGFLHEVDRMRKAGLAQGGSLDNAVVIDGEAVLNEGGLRYPDEFVRHKLLDSVGDLYLAGAPIIGHFSGVRAGHALNLRLLQALFASEHAWAWVAPTTEELGLAGEAGGATVPDRAVAAWA